MWSGAHLGEDGLSRRTWSTGATGDEEGGEIQYVCDLFVFYLGWISLKLQLRKESKLL